MKLITKIGTRKQGRATISWGLFLCPYCKQEVKKRLSGGKRDQSCGCAKHKLQAEKIRIYGGDSIKSSKNHFIYKIWQGMKQRCSDPNNKVYHRYGGRGIKICEEWIPSYPTFKKFALEHGAKKGLQINRIDNDGNYEPSNCQFVTKLENLRNTFRVILSMEKARLIRSLFLTKLYSYSLLARMFFVKRDTIYRLIRNRTWKENESVGEET